MARLSEEHFKSNSDTPARKHSRFKEIFKYRSIPHSNSASPAIITTASPVLRPLGSPTMKPGYEQVGLLPSERTSLETAKRLLEENGGAAVKEAIEDDLQGLKDVCMPGDLNMGHDLLGVTRADEIAKRVTKEQKEEQKRKNERNFGEESSGHQNERAEHVDFAEGSSSSFLVLRTAESKRKLEALAPSQDNLAKQSLSKTFGNRRFEDEPHDWDSIFVNGPSSKQASSTSDVSRFEDPLNEGIREYVSTKIREALLEHDRGQSVTR